MESLFYINNDWKFAFTYEEGMTEDDYDESKMEDVRIPHTVKVTPYNYFDESCYQTIAAYRRWIDAPKDWQNKRVFLRFEAIAHISQVYVNGQLCAEHRCGYTEFKAEISEYLNFGEKNLIAVVVNTREDSNVPPFGNVIDYMTYGGIYRDVSIEVKNRHYIDDVFVKTSGKKIEAELSFDEELKEIITVKTYIRRWNPQSEEEFEQLTVGNVDITGISRIECEYDKAELWDIDTPNLYEFKTELCMEGELIDSKIVRFGFRKCEFKSDGFYLNDRKVKLRGLNRHQSYAYVGYAMPKRAQVNDADILKYELGVNAVRTSHYPQSHYFIDRCDELGLLVFTEIPGWQYIGDKEWKKQVVQNTIDMVKYYRNHPSIIIWGVRVNESQDDDELYRETNRIAHTMDPTRSTGGVRFLQKSSLLEDVYTYNDFVHNGTNRGLDDKKTVTSDLDKAYLVTEYNGHMFPTKMFDCEEHKTEHCKRHATVLNALYHNEDIAGGFGWCMFDYNTHKDFGSGDRICYHGVLDMFRNKKPAAEVYASQGDTDNILFVSSSMDIGEHPAGYIGDVFIYTNADSVRVYKNDEFVKEFTPDKETFGAMPHPPVIVNDFIGELMAKHENMSDKNAEAIKEVLFAIAKYGQNDLPFKIKTKMLKLMMTEHLTFEYGLNLYYKYIGNWGANVTTYRFEAVKNGEVVKSVVKKPGTRADLICTVDTNVLCEENTYDVASVRIVAVDENGNHLPFYMQPVKLEVQGPIEIIGPDVINMVGGAFGTYVKTTGEKGDAKLTLTTTSGITKTIDFVVR